MKNEILILTIRRCGVPDLYDIARFLARITKNYFFYHGPVNERECFSELKTVLYQTPFIQSVLKFRKMMFSHSGYLPARVRKKVV